MRIRREMMALYSIAGEVLGLEGAQEEIEKYCGGFECGEPGAAPDIRLTVISADELPEPAVRPSMKAVFGVRYAALPAGEEPWRHILTVEPGGREYLLANEDWSEALLATDPSYHKSFFEPQPRWAGLIMCAFYLRLSFAGTLLLHASAVEYEGKAVIFTAPSGTGKTTQAELWETYAGATILNGDKVFLRLRDGKVLAWGSPWSGSSPYRVNACAESAAIVVLSQAPANQLSRLPVFAALGEFTPNAFLPVWEKTVLGSGMAVLDRVFSTVPVYHLAARKDEEAVRLVKEAVFGPGKREKS